jgi:hypothetical protein
MVEGPAMQIIEDTFDPTGLWTTADGTVRKLLLPNGRYLVMKGVASKWHQGDYVVAGERIEYSSDEGSSGSAVISGGVIYSQKGEALYPEDREASNKA